MSIGDKIGHAAQNLTGRAKEAFGHVTDNPDLVAEGEAQQVEAQVGRAADRVEDATDDLRQGADEVKDDVSDALGDARDNVGRAIGDAKDAITG
jgi:uncharacterized protein YjbJ (UPF0337 family)